jgi:hypothetical protein
MFCQLTNRSLDYRQPWPHTGYNCFSCDWNTHMVRFYSTFFTIQLADCSYSQLAGTLSVTDLLELGTELNLCPSFLLFMYAWRQKVLEYFSDCWIFLIYIYDRVCEVAASAMKISSHLLYAPQPAGGCRRGSNSSLNIVVSQCCESLQQYVITYN